MDRRSTHAAAQLKQRGPLHVEPTSTETSIDGAVRGGPREVGAASSGSIRLSDVDIARSAQGMLQSITLLPTGSIEVVVDGGWITLSGSVQWSYQKAAAAAAVRHAIGATGVTDRVTVIQVGPAPATRSPFDPLFGRR